MENLKATLNEFREENILCDAIIKSKGGEHHVHKVLLAAASNFFKTMFLSDFLEAQSGFIKLEDIESGLVEALVEYIYTENIDINASNGFDLYCIADRLEVIGLKKTCEMFLVNNMDISTCLSIMRLAQSVNEGVLEKKAFGYIVDHFQDFSGSRDFDDLTAKELTSFCEQENLNIETEDDLYKAVIAWADKCPNTRDGSLPDIMAYIRFPLMSLEFLEINVINNDRICDEKWNERVFDIYHRTCRYYKYNKKDAFFTAPRNLACYSRKFRAPSQLICITGGWSNGHCLEICECYNMRTDEWVVATQLRDPNGSRCYYGSVVNAKRIYFAGGYDGNSYLNSVRCFEPETKTWSEMAPMHKKRCFTNLVNYGDSIYAIAGFDGMKRLSCVERYNYSTNQWTRVATLDTSRSDSSAVVSGGFIYVIGGYSGGSLCSVEYYDGGVWRYAAPMNAKRSGAGAVALNDGRIFVVGGFDGVSRQKTTEFYDQEKDAWLFGPSMELARSNFAICVVRNFVYVIGGYTGEGTLRDVERFDVARNTWTAISKLNFSRSAIIANILVGLPNTEDFVPLRTHTNACDSALDRYGQGNSVLDTFLGT